mgnify:CR=1 FL=1
MDIHYRFVASGHQDVEKAFAGIEARARASKKATDDAGRSAARGGSAGAGGRGGVDRQYKEAERAAARYEREAKRETSIAERAAIAKQRSAARSQRYVAKLRDKHFADTQRAEDKAAQDTVRRAERTAQQAARKEVAAKKRATAEAAANRKQSVGTLKDLAGGAFLGAVGTGTALIGGAARESMALQEQAASIAIQGRGRGEKLRDVNQLRRGFERTAINTPGQSASGIADAVARFVSLTGDLDTALKSQDAFAMIASGSGANVGDVATAAASLSQQFDIKNVEDMTEALAALNIQGKNGAFELKDAAAQMQALAAAGGAFGLPKGVGGVKILGGLTQIARTSTKSSDEASFAVSALFRQFGSKQKELRSQGVDVYKDGKVRDIRDLIVDSISKVGGTDVAKKQEGLQAIFGDEGMKGIKSLVSQYNTEFAKAGGTDAEKTAAATEKLRERFAKAIDTVDAVSETEQDAAARQRNASAQVSSAWEAIKANTADKLLPSLAKMAESLSGKESMLDPFIEAVGLAAEAVSWLAEATGFKKAKTKAEVLTEAERKSDKVAKEALAAGPMTPEKFGEVYSGADAAYNALWGIPAAGGATAPMSLDQAVEAYLKANPDTATPDAMDANRAAAQSLLMTGGNDWFLKNFGGENQAQQDIRHQTAGQYTLADVGQDGGSGTVKTEDIQTALAAAATAAKDAAAAMAKVAAAGGAQGSIIGGPGT